MKPSIKRVFGAGIVLAVMASQAQAGTHIGLNIGAPVVYQPAPVYYAPQPVYYQPAPVYYQPAPSYRFIYSNGWDRHRHGYDWGYWNRGRGHGHGHGRGHGRH